MPYTTLATVVAGQPISTTTFGNQVKANFDAAFPLGVDAWTTWTPTLTQSGSVSHTVSRARYQRIGRTVILLALLSLTGSGTSGNAIVLGGFPVSAASTNAILGFFRYFDAGNTIYAGTAFGASSTTAQFQVSSNGNPMGVNPTFGAASGDSLWAMVIYEASS
jgi:hypothetical protein